jgi:hypothetical protein
MTSVDVILDLRQWPRRVRDAEGLTALWGEVERALNGTDLGRRPVCRVTLAEGVAGVHLAHASGWPAVARPSTAFRVVNVLERPPVLHPCSTCADAEGVFRCAGCGESSKLCADHAVVLDGALTGTCSRHRPGCAECGQPATFWCAGPGCGGRSAHCDRHRHPQTQQETWPCCQKCHGLSFPECSVASCRNVGLSACEYTDSKLNGCGTRMCLAHLRRWQVYGPERVGLALCTRHEPALAALPAAELIHRIVAGTFARSLGDPTADPLPTLRGFAHTLRNFRHFGQADDYRWIHGTLCEAGKVFAKAPVGAQVAAFLRQRDLGDGAAPGRSRRPWRRELEDLDVAARRGQDLVKKAREVLRAKGGQDGARLAADLGYGGYVEPRRVGDEARPGRLFVVVPSARRDVFRDWQDRLGQELSTRAGAEIVVQRHRGGGSAS